MWVILTKKIFGPQRETQLQQESQVAHPNEKPRPKKTIWFKTESTTDEKNAIDNYCCLSKKNSKLLLEDVCT